MSDVVKTPREELECEKRYLYEYSIFWECNDGSKYQILEDNVCDLLNELSEENKQLREVLEKTNPYYNCTIETKDDLLHLQHIFKICNLLIDDAVTEEDYDIAIESISQFYNRMQHFDQDKNCEKRTNYIDFLKFGK